MSTLQCVKIIVSLNQCKVQTVLHHYTMQSVQLATSQLQDKCKICYVTNKFKVDYATTTMQM